MNPTGADVVSTKKRVAVLISGRGSNMRALASAAERPDFPAEIAVVLSNRPDAAGLNAAASAGIPVVVVDHRPFGAAREAFEQALTLELESRGIEIVCLAGFMRLLSPWFVRRWRGRVLNIHPALLPSFKGLDTHARALAAGVKIHGATVHLVSEEMDAGPIIAQAALAVHVDDTAHTLADRVLALEHRIYPWALKLVAQGRVRAADDRCLVDADAGDEVLLAPRPETAEADD
jgi:phosphoribosylglycinamide formyltransferase-1